MMLMLGKSSSSQVWTNSSVVDMLNRGKRSIQFDNEDPGMGSWPSIEKIIRDVERNLKAKERQHPAFPLSYKWDTSQLADLIEEDDETGRHRSAASGIQHERRESYREFPAPVHTTARPLNSDRFVYKRVEMKDKKILAISIRKPIRTTTAPTHGNPTFQDQWRAVSHSKAHLHHRWLQKGKLRGKLLT